MAARCAKSRRAGTARFSTSPSRATADAARHGERPWTDAAVCGERRAAARDADSRARVTSATSRPRSAAPWCCGTTSPRLPISIYCPRRANGAGSRARTPSSSRPARSATFEQFSFAGWNDEKVYGYVVNPPGFDKGKKYPIAFIVHGGPQVSFQNHWNWRWNAQTFAARGYATVFIDFHGSPGYGQAFTDSISQHWGDRPFEDLKKGFAAALQKFPWLDGKRACSLGASYGGYMQNWIAGQLARRFPLHRESRRHLRHAVDVLHHRGTVVHGVGERRALPRGARDPRALQSGPTTSSSGARRCW